MKPPRRPSGKPTVQRPKPGRLAWKATAGRPSPRHHRPMPQRRLRLARGGVQPLQNPGEPALGSHPPAAGHPNLEAGGVAEMPDMPEGPLGTPGAYDQADRGARDHAVQVGAPGRGEVRATIGTETCGRSGAGSVAKASRIRTASHRPFQSNGLRYHGLLRATRRRFDPSSSPSARSSQAVYSPGELVGNKAQ